MQVGQQVARHREQPRPHGAVTELELGQLPPRPQQHLLHHVLGPLPVAGEAQAEREQRPSVLRMQQPHQIRVAVRPGRPGSRGAQTPRPPVSRHPAVHADIPVPAGYE